MKFKVYMMFDRVAGKYQNIFMSISDYTAVRDFKAMLEKHPYSEDMELYRIGEFDNDSGEMTVEKFFVCSYAAVQEVKE